MTLKTAEHIRTVQALRKGRRTAEKIDAEALLREPLPEQGQKLVMALQVAFLYLGPMKSFLEAASMVMLKVPFSPEVLIRLLYRQQSEKTTTNLVACVNSILRAAVDEGVSAKAYEDLLFNDVEQIKGLVADTQEESAV